MYKDKKCRVCGKLFTPTNANQKYCSSECAKVNAKLKDQAKRSAVQKECEWCGRSFHPRTNTQKYCDGVHYRECEVCGKLFEIDLRKQDKPRTCSKECSYKLRFKNGNPFSRLECREKAKSTMMKKYGVEHPMKSQEFIDKMTATYVEHTGYTSPMKNPEVRSRIASSGRYSKLEERIIQLLTSYDIQFEHHKMVSNGDLSHEFDFYLPQLNLYVDADGLFYHGYLDDPNGKQVIDYYDEDRLALIPEDSRFYLIVEGEEDKSVAELSRLLHQELNIDEYDTEIFKWCRSIEFPYPTYTEDRMLKDWNRLCEYYSDKYVPQCRLGESVIKHYHRSLYSARVGNYVSPLDGWYDDKLLSKVIKNRLIYINNIDPSKVLRGFNVSKLCPRVSVFNPVLARYLTLKYLDEYIGIIDPFSGWSGRMLGVCSTGKLYIGSDLNAEAVKESQKIAEFLHLPADIQNQDILQSKGGGQALLTCPPYGKKEIYGNETVFHTCDEWIDIILQQFDCERYVFVVDKTEKYTDKIVEEIASTSHFNTVKEYVIVI